MKELSIQIKIYPVTSMRQDVYRFMADEFEFTPVPDPQRRAAVSIAIKI